MAKKKKNQTSPPAPTHPNLMEGIKMTKKRKIHTSTLNKCSSSTIPCTNETGRPRSKKMTKKKKNQMPTLKKCSNSSNSSNNKSCSYTTVVQKKTTITTIITTNTTLLPEDNMDEDISLYICVLKDAKDNSAPTFTWFKIDPQACTGADGVPLELLTPFCQMPDSTPEGFQAVAFGSEIYTLGGSNKVFVCDTLASPPIWKEYPSMESPREFPAAAVVDGHIYVIGSLHSGVNDFDPWAEVFDPSSQTWATLPSTPDDFVKTSNFVFAKQRGELIILSLESGNSLAHGFHCKSRSWNKIPISGSNRCFVVLSRARSIAVGDMVYTFSNRNLYAWDLSRLKPRVKQVYGLEEAIKQIPHYNGLVVHIVYIGRGKMCLIWYGVSSALNNTIIIYCLKFWVGTRPGGSRLHAIIDRCDKYIADGDEISNCLTI